MSDRLRVQYDAQIFERQVHGGISRYFSELLRESYSQADRASVDIGALFVKTDRARAVSRRRLRPWPTRCGRLAAAANRVYARVRRPDVVHSTYYDPAFLSLAVRGKHVVTVHDMIPEDFPGLFGNSDPHAGKAAYLRAADAVVCVSEYTRSRLLAHMPDLGVPITVIHEAAAPLPPPAGATPATDVLYVGRRDGYKNFDALLQAMSLLKGVGVQVSLLAVGAGRWTAPEKERLVELDIHGQSTQRQLNDGELHAAYRSAKALVVPSLAEGFGLPVVEAMTSGCPCLLSDAGSLPEIGADAAAYFVSSRPEQLAQTLDRLLHDPAQRELLIARGRQRAADFSWRKAYAQTLEVYERTVRDGEGTPS